MRKRLLLLALTAAAAACTKHHAAGPATHPIDLPDPAAVDTMWAFAPDDTAVGIVIGEGDAEKVLAALHAAEEVVSADPTGRGLVHEMLGDARERLGIDPFDAAAWKAKGVDVGKGAAVFAAADAPLLMVLPAGDVDVLRTTLGQHHTAKEQGLDVDRFPDLDLVCASIADRYMCSSDVRRLAAAGQPHPSAIAARVKALPREQRGLVEVYAEPTAEPFESISHELRPLVDAKGFFASLQLPRDGAVVHAWVMGEPANGFGTALTGADAPRDPHDRGAVSVVRVSGGVASLFAMEHGGDDPHGRIVGGMQDVELITAGQGILAGALVARMKDPAAAGKALAGLCDQIAHVGSPIKEVGWADGACGVSLMLMPNVQIDLRLAMDGDRLVVGDPSFRLADHKGTAENAVGSPEARAVLMGRSTFAAWGRGFDLAASLPRELHAMVPDKIAPIVELVSWIGLHVYEAAGMVDVEADGIHVLVRLTTFGGDPDDVRAQYAAAIAKRQADDDAGYRAALAELAKAHPASLAARQAALVAEGYPVMGGGTGILAAIAIPAFMKYMVRSKTVEAVENVKKIYDGARSYYMEESNQRGAVTPIPRQFPTSAPMTPALGTCCRQQDGKCAPNPAIWNANAWMALKFSMDDPHYYSYEFVSAGTDANAKFTARAEGDLDCDGVYSTFEMVGAADADGNVTGSAGIFKDNELE